MSIKLIIAENSLLPSTWRHIETDDLLASLKGYYGEKFPVNTRIYDGNVSKTNDVTPQSEADIEALTHIKGPVYVVTFPGEPITLIAIAVLALVVVAAIAFRPKVPNSTSRRVDNTSPNNALSGRTNSIRINGRIPDIFGTVRSTPDLIAVPYSVFEDHIEIEYTYMCIGRGTYDIQANDVRDGQTAVSLIDGSTAEIFGPDTSPNLPGAGPQLRIGSPITRRVINALRSKSVNGQTLLASNEDTFNNNVARFDFYYPNAIVMPRDDNGTDYPGLTDDSTPNFNDLLDPGDSVFITTAGQTDIFGLNLTAVGETNVPVFRINDDVIGSPVGDFDCRFYADGRIEFQTLTGIGGEAHPLNLAGHGYLRLSNATVTDGVHTVTLDGKYVVSAHNDNTLIAYRANYSRLDWDNIAAFSGGVTPYKTCSFQFPAYLDINLSGEYTVNANVAGNEFNLATPDNIRINNDWAWLYFINNYAGDNGSRLLAQQAYFAASDFDQWIGPFVLDVTTTKEIIANFVAPQGMYKDDGTTQIATSVDIQVGIYPCMPTGEPSGLGPEQFFTITVEGSATKRGTRAATLYAPLVSAGRYAVRARRVTIKDVAFTGQISDEVKWRDLYSSSPVGDIAFGDITTVHCRTAGTPEALAVSERQINMLVSRMLPLRVGNTDVFTDTLTATSSADEIIAFLCLDPKIGNRNVSEVNLNNIYDTIDEVKAYFGIFAAGEFNYTFDSDNLSFEETLATVAAAVFCTAHRRGNVIELTFERLNDNSRLLFNHRNKVPSSEKRSVTFGNVDDYDGIEYQYVSPIDDAVVTYYIPEDRTAVKPRKVESIGVRSYTQAYLHAWREYNRLLYQHTAIEFTATQEAEVLALTDRVLIADNTRPDTQDGHIESQDGLVLELSQPAVLRAGVEYIISLQLPSGIVENIDITPGDDPYHCVLATPPSEELVTDDESFVRTLYVIVRAEDGETDAALIVNKEPQSNFTTAVQAINYDARYYANDLDFI